MKKSRRQRNRERARGSSVSEANYLDVRQVTMTQRETTQASPEEQEQEVAVRTIGSRFRRRASFFTIISVAILFVWGGYRFTQTQLARACREAQRESRWEELEVLARRWSWWEPRNPDVWLMLADAVQHQNRFLEAAEYLENVPRNSQKALAALLMASQLLYGPANRPLEGETVSRKLLELEPRATKAHANLIRFYAYTLQRKKMVQQFREAIAVKQEPREAYIFYYLIDTLNLAGAEQLNSLWLTTSPDEELFLVARALQWSTVSESKSDATVKSGDESVLNEREVVVRQLLERFPNNLNLLADQIDAEIVKGRLPEVLALMAKASVEAENDNRFWRYKGWVHYVRNEYPEAENAYRTALKIHPMDWHSLNRLGEVLRAKKDVAEVARIQNLVERMQSLRSAIRKVEVIEKVPLEVLNELREIARECGDTLIAEALEDRLRQTEID